MSDADQYTRWRAALGGAKLDMGERGNPPAGFFRRNAGKRGWEAFAVWYQDGDVFCHRNMFGDGSNMSAEQIDELFASEVYAIPHGVYTAVADGADWPVEHTARLTLKEIAAGTAMTEDLGRAKKGLDLEEVAENPRATIGGNNPPEEMTPDQSILDRITKARDRVKAWLAGIGGAPKTKEEADKVADYATKFGTLHAEAEKAFKAEKQPWLEGGRVVDAKWKFRDEAKTLRETHLAIANKWINAEKARLKEEADKAHAAALEAAKQESAETGEPIEEIAAPVVAKVTLGNTRTVSQHTRKIYFAKDIKLFSAYLAGLENPPPEYLETLNKLAHRLGTAGVIAPGVEEDKRSAAA